MGERIGGYQCLTPMKTAGSGSARWCIAARGYERYFLKEFLSPVYPAQPHTPLGQRQLERCAAFEKRKQQLYAASSCVIGDVLVPVIDFFRSGGHYYAVSEALPEGCLTAAETCGLRPEDRRKILYELALCLQRLHTQGIVHADLKPEHVLILQRPDGWRVKLIDLDSGFLTEERLPQEPEGDPVYLAPEMFLRMTGQETALGTAVDSFAFGILIHQIWMGKLPRFARERYQYLYEAALNKGDILLELPERWEPAVRQMLAADPSQRPSDAEVSALFAPEKQQTDHCPVRNGLSGLLKK